MFLHRSEHDQDSLTLALEPSEDVCTGFITNTTTARGMHVTLVYVWKITSK
jgi:hypothetical protein